MDMTKELKVEIDYRIGWANSIVANFDIDLESSNVKRDIKDCIDFISQAVKGNRNRDIMVTITPADGLSLKMDLSKRFIMEDLKNGFQERPYIMDEGYLQTKPITFDLQVNGRLELKKAVTKSIKDIYKTF